MKEEHGTCSYCGEHHAADDAQLLADEIAYHEERCEQNPNNARGQ
jgi:hypothetical protein